MYLEAQAAYTWGRQGQRLAYHTLGMNKRRSGTPSSFNSFVAMHEKRGDRQTGRDQSTITIDSIDSQMLGKQHKNLRYCSIRMV
jgi:hypothetical protein